MKEHVKIKMDEYGEKHRFWTDQAIGQFGQATNLFFIINAGFLAYLTSSDKMRSAFEINFQGNFSISNLLFMMSILLSLLSVIFSGFTVLSRLHDLRLTRHTIWIRRKSYRKWEKDFPDNHKTLPMKSFVKEVKCFANTLLNKKYFIVDEDIENWENLEIKFEKLRERNLLLGRFSWRCLNYQIVFLILSFSFFIASHWA